MGTFETGIIKVQGLLEKSGLKIPEYQRPYKWVLKHVNQLIDDIQFHRTKPAYRFGTIVFHQEGDGFFVVDGQQRTITILLIALAISNNAELASKLEKSNLKPIHSESLTNLNFPNPISRYNIRENYREIERRVQEFDVATVVFFYKHCDFVEVVLKDISEAFQFFDSQNSRGKDLAPHDLLKAFHLREMAKNSTEEEQFGVVDAWEKLGNHKLSTLFEDYLFRIRRWSKSRSARYFQKEDVSLFKGISPDGGNKFPFMEQSRMTNHFVDSYNRNHDRRLDAQILDYPFQLDQVIVNGKRFFEWVTHYNARINGLKNSVKHIHSVDEIFMMLDSYDGHWRAGDKYLRNLFECALVYYIDRFGMIDIQRVAEKLFLWAFRIRLTQSRVYLASMDNRAVYDSPHVFRIIKEALHPHAVLSIQQADVVKVEFRGAKAIEDYFKKMGYLSEGATS